MGSSKRKQGVFMEKTRLEMPTGKNAANVPDIRNELRSGSGLKGVKRTTAIAATVLVLGGCAGMPINNQQIGGVVGGIAGGVIGNQIGSGNGRTAATIIGTIGGYMLGGAVGKSMDQADQARMAQSLNSSPNGQTSQWVNPNTGNQYSVTPTRTYYSKANKGYCREFDTKVLIGNVTHNAYGTACRQPDGSWKIVK
jgi:surface antigen